MKRIGRLLLKPLRDLSVIRREGSSLSEGYRSETEYNYSQGIAAIATLLLAVGTFWMVCQTKRAADAARDSIKLTESLAVEQAWPRIRVALSQLDSRLDSSDSTQRHELGTSVKLDALHYSIWNDGKDVALLTRTRYELTPTSKPLSDRVLLDTHELKSELAIQPGSSCPRNESDLSLQALRTDSAYLHICLTSSPSVGGREYFLESIYGFKIGVPGVTRCLGAGGVREGRKIVRDRP